MTLVLMFRFGGFDSLQVKAVPVTVNILMCECGTHGTCDFDVVPAGQAANATFKLVACVCNTGYAGMR